jgi:sec-independent protein translocase protein TatB
MFDIGFSEILLCAIVALLVLGPEKLPGAVRTASLWIGRFRRAFNDVKSEIEREIGADDIRRQLHNEQVMKKLESGKQQLQQLQNELRAIEQSARRDIEASESTDAPVATAPATTAAASAPQAPAPAESGTASGDRPA